jgi:flagellar hook-basal body complex protein FliE
MIAALPLISSALSMLTSSDAVGSAAKSATQGADFGQVLAQMSSGTVGSLKSAETLSVQGLEGKANLQEVVQSVMSAQENLQSALAIRDKAVSAFTDISHMTI